MNYNARRLYRYHHDPEYRRKRILTNTIAKTKRQIRFHERMIQEYTERLKTLTEGDHHRP